MEFTSAHKKRTAILLIWLLIYLATVPMQLSNYVLCIGTDGHVEFEIAVNGRCTDAHDPHEAHTEVVSPADTAEDNHCGPCLDLAIFVSLDIEPYLTPVQDMLIPPPDSVTALSVHRANGSVLPTHTQLPDIPSVIDPTLVFLRTMMLLI